MKVDGKQIALRDGERERLDSEKVPSCVLCLLSFYRDETARPHLCGRCREESAPNVVL